MLAPFPERDLLVEAARVSRPWGEWLRSLLVAVNGVSGTWTPSDASGAALTFTNLTGNCVYLKVGTVVSVAFRVTYPATANGAAALIGGLPYASQATTVSVQGGTITLSDEATAARLLVTTDATTFGIYTTAGAAVTNATMSGNDLRGTIAYTAAS